MTKAAAARTASTPIAPISLALAPMALALIVLSALPDRATAAPHTRRRPAAVEVTLLERRPIDHGLISVKAVHDGGQGRAERVTAEVDCRDRAIHVLSRESLPGDRRPLDPADPLGWRPVSPGEADFGIWDKTCGEDRPQPPPTSASANLAKPYTASSDAPPVVFKTRGSYRLQIGSFKTRQLAEEALASAGARLNIPQAELSVQAATVQGAPVYRAIINGASSQDEARRTCQRLHDQGGDCLVLAHAAHP